MIRMVGIVSAATLLIACGSDGGNGSPSQNNETSCPTTTGPTEHSKDVVADEVWTAEGSPHLVTWDVRVRDGATLTIEPCAEVHFAAGKGLVVGFGGTPATLVARGTEKRPIAFAGIDGARWSSVIVNELATASFAHATLEGGGQDVGGGTLGSILHARGSAAYPLVERISVDSVTVRDAIGPGVFLAGNAAFSVGSTGLTITRSGSEEFPWPVVGTPANIGSVPPGSYTGNARDELAMRTSEFDIAEDAVWADRGVPYRTAGIPGSYVRVSAEAGASLTLEEGVELRMAPGTFLWIGHESTGPGTLQTLGAAEKPVTITSANDEPAAGDWIGIFFRGNEISPNNRIEHTRVEYAGGDCRCSYNNCVPGGMSMDAAIHFDHVAPDQSFIKNTSIFRSAGHGIQRAWVLTDLNVTTSFLDTNAFEEIAGCRQTLYAETGNVCPEPVPCE